MQYFNKCISVVIIADNNSEYLNRAINSVDKQTDEIIIVNTSNSALNLNYKSSGAIINVHHFPWCNDFSAARNYGIEKTNSEICFMLDSDEYLSQDSQKNFRSEVLELFNTDSEALYSPLINNLNGQLLRNNPRLFRIRKGLRYVGCVHEYLFEENSKNIHTPSIIIEHTGYLGKLLCEEKKLRNKVLLDRQIIAEPENLRWKFFLLRYIEKTDPKRIDIMRFFFHKHLPFDTEHEVYCLNVVCRYMIEMLDEGLYEEVLNKSSDVIVHYPCKEIAKIYAAAHFLLHKDSPAMYKKIDDYISNIEQLSSDEFITEVISPQSFERIKSEIRCLLEK
ncbi:glycosyltransferase [Edaphovirga cremea]|uniref:glycosyltransferase n=1 Tax=Edaphovirga cremea TaxID=2267246 RepID=UPI000DEFEAF1|nr:glycosyltransferase [Edaphovirga cremea]